MTPTDKPVVMFRESPAGSPEAVRVWFYPGETYGYEFVYPHDQAMKIARANHTPVLSTSSAVKSGSDVEQVASMKSADVARIDENGGVASSDEALKDSTRAPASSPAHAQATTTTSAASRTAVGTTGASETPTPASTNTMARNAKASRQHLPRTASSLPLLAVLSGLMLAVGIALGVGRRSTNV